MINFYILTKEKFNDLNAKYKSLFQSLDAP